MLVCHYYLSVVTVAFLSHLPLWYILSLLIITLLFTHIRNLQSIPVRHYL
jgi:hypothetical protein